MRSQDEADHPMSLNHVSGSLPTLFLYKKVAGDEKEETGKLFGSEKRT